MTLVPILQIVFFYLAIGGNPIGLKLGIVSGEIDNLQECTNTSLITTFVHDYTCDLHKISCRFLNEIDDSVAEKVFYETFDEAFTDAKKGVIVGIIEFASNFSDSLYEVQEIGSKADEASRTNSKINIYLDQTNQQLTFFLQRKLSEIYKNYSESLSSDCQLSKKLNNVPVEFMKPIYGEHDADFKQTMAPAMIMV